MSAPAEWHQRVEAELRRRGWTGNGEMKGRCLEPAHKDDSPSATWNSGKGAGRCHGCNSRWSLKAAAELLGIDLQGPSRNGNARERSWEIRDASGEVIAVHHRRDVPGMDKRLWWSRPGVDRGLGGLPVAELPLFGAHLLRPREPGDDSPVFIVEGEPAADALLEIGVLAVGTVTGASGTPAPSALEILRGRHVVVWPDSDSDRSKGEAHMERVAAALAGIASSVRLWAPEGLGEGGDAVQFIELHGADPVALVERAEAEARSLPTVGSEAPAATSRLPAGFMTLSTLRSHPELLVPPDPVVPGLAWKGRVTLLAGREKLGKSTLASCAAAAVTQGRDFLGESTTAAPVVWATWEEAAFDVDDRFARFHAEPDLLTLGIRPDPPLDALEAVVAATSPALVVVDSLMAMVSGMVTDTANAAQWQPILGRLVRMAQAPGGPALVLLHHAKKSDGAYRDSSSIGAAVDQILTLGTPPLRPELRSVTPVGRFTVEPYAWGFTEDGYDLMRVGGVATSDSDIETEVLAYVAEHAGCTMTDLKRAIRGRAAAIVEAVERLLTAGRLVEAPGPRNSRKLFVAVPS